MDNQAFSKEIHEEVQRWVVALFAVFKANIAAKKLQLTGELKDSFQSFVTQNAQQLATKLQVKFAQQGRFQDMRAVTYTKRPPLDVMEDFVREVGLGAFDYVPGYNDRFPISQDKAIRRIAWGIRESFFQKGQILQKKRWRYAKSFYAEVSDLRDRLQILLLDHTAKFTTSNLTNL